MKQNLSPLSHQCKHMSYLVVMFSSPLPSQILRGPLHLVRWFVFLLTVHLVRWFVFNQEFFSFFSLIKKTFKCTIYLAFKTISKSLSIMNMSRENSWETSLCCSKKNISIYLEFQVPKGLLDSWWSFLNQRNNILFPLFLREEKQGWLILGSQFNCTSSCPFFCITESLTHPKFK